MEPSDLKDASFLAELAAQAIRLTLGGGREEDPEPQRSRRV